MATVGDVLQTAPIFIPFGNVSKGTLEMKITKQPVISGARGLNYPAGYLVTKIEANMDLTCDEVSIDNLQRLMLSAAPAAQTQSTGTVSAQLATVSPNNIIQCLATIGGVVMPVYNVTVTTLETVGGSPTVYVQGTDYEVDTEAGLIWIMPTGSIPANTPITIAFTYAAYTKPLIVAGSQPVFYGHIIYKSDVPYGRNFMVKGYGSITPKKGIDLTSDKPIQLEFNVDFMLNNNYPSLVQMIPMN